VAVVLDVVSRRVVGSRDGRPPTHRAGRRCVGHGHLEPAARQGLVHHSDQGCQSTSLAFGRRLREAGLVASMGSVGDCDDNAVTESFFATLECELLDRTRFATRTQARTAVFDSLEGFYNRIRRHSTLGYLSPAEYERRPTRYPAA
jgi:putative transposase